MAASFGEQIKAAREAQGITLREVSEQTRITLRHLNAIENEDFKALPGGVFNRSFIKSYARYIGFDENKALQLYQDAAREQSGGIEEATFAQTQPKVYTDDRTARAPMTNLVLVGAVLLLFGLGLWGFVRYFGTDAQKTPVAPTTPTPAPLIAANPSPAPSATPMPGATATPSASGSPSATGSPSTSASPSAPPPTPPPAGGFALQVRAKDKAVRVATGLDGGKLETFTLKPGESRDFSPQTSLSVEYTEPGGELMDIYVNGQPIVMPLQGKQAGKFKIVSFVIGRDSYQSMLQSGAPAATPTPQ